MVDPENLYTAEEIAQVFGVPAQEIKEAFRECNGPYMTDAYRVTLYPFPGDARRKTIVRDEIEKIRLFLVTRRVPVPAQVPEDIPHLPR